MGLSPTLWRTCRVLSGPTRLSLFRRIIEEPGQFVSQLAKAENISIPRASQELRRLQSRGLVGVERPGRHVRYFPESDPLVSSAKPILRAMQETCAQNPRSEDGRIAKLAHGLSHEKRMAVVRALRTGPLRFDGLQAELGMSHQTLRHHLKFLEAGGWVERAGKAWRLCPGDDPLAKCLLKML